MQALAEITVDADYYLFARLYQVHDGGLHPGAALARNRYRQTVVCLEDVAQQLLRLVHRADEKRVEVSDQRRAHHTKHAVVNGTRPRAEQDSARRIQRRYHRRVGYCHIELNSPCKK